MMTEKTTPLLYADYTDWHRGRDFFSLWYLLVDDALSSYCRTLAQACRQWLCPDYHRQFHVTLFVSGFYVPQKQYADEFDEKDLTRQINELNKHHPKKFRLTLEKLGTFQNSLHIKLAHDDNLTHLRQILTATHPEISPAVYVPHITLGFYRGEYEMIDIINKINKINIEPRSFDVHRLVFGGYVPTELQGRLSHRYFLELR